MHHWFIANSTAGSNGLSHVGNAGWNLFPIPGVWNNFVGNGGAFFALTRIGIGVGAPTAVGGATYGTYTASVRSGSGCLATVPQVIQSNEK